MYKRIVSILIIICMLLQCSAVIGYAAEKTDVDYGNISHSIEEQFPALKEFGLDIDIEDTVAIGEQIALYEVMPDGVYCNQSIYPVYVKDMLSAFAVSIDGIHYQITTDLVKELSTYKGRSIALIYDNSNCYVYDGVSCSSLFEYAVSQDYRGCLKDVDLNDCDIKLQILQSRTHLDINSENILYATQAYYSVSVTGVPQVYSKTCWAAMIAMIKNCLSGSSLTAYNVATNVMGSTSSLVFNQGLTDSTIVSQMNSKYSLSYNYYNGVRSDSILEASITSGYPIFGSFTQAVTDSRHAGVIYGINIISGYVSVKDPRYITLNSTYSYSAYYSSGAYRYISLYNNEQHTLTRTICPSSAIY